VPGHPGPVPGHPGPGPGYPVPWLPPPPALSPAGQPLASFVDRLLAYLIDIAIFVGVSLVLAVPVVAVFFFAFVPGLAEQTELDGTLADPAPWPFILALLGIELGYVVLLMLFYYVYYVEFQLRKNGQTVGKKAMTIRVVPLNPDGTLTRGALAKRFLVQGVAGSLIPFFSYLDGFWQLWDKPFQQCLHDKFAQTVVVKVNT
jgi:uncharacterized RDD family membrane protein YckC